VRPYSKVVMFAPYAFNVNFGKAALKDNDYAETVSAARAALWQNRRPLLESLDLELTERCDNNCIHCYINLPADDVKAREKELSTDDIKGILEEAASLGCINVRFTGGEPLIREDFEELYLFARRLGLKVLIFTNATHITPHLAELFVRIPPLVEMEVTVYGMNRSSYEAVTRTPGSFEAAWKGINLLIEKGVPFGVKGTALSASRGEMEQFEAWAGRIPWMHGPPTFSATFYLRSRRDSDEKNRLIRSLRMSPEEGLKLSARYKEAYIDGMKQFCASYARPTGDRLFACGAGVGSGCVDAYGNLQLCMTLRHPDTVYDLRSGSLKDALTRFFPEIRATRASNPEYLARCARCFLKGLCSQCPAMSWMEHGTLDTPVEYQCQIAHAQARYLGLLEDGEMSWEVRDWREKIKGFTGAEPTVTEEELIETCRSEV